MEVQHIKLLHYVLIILLVLAPVRSVMAEQNSACDMDEMPAVMSDASTHQNHYSQIEPDTVVPDSVDTTVETEKSQQMQHNCCCCDGNACASDCNMGLAVSLLTRVSTYTPVFSSAEYVTIFSIDILVRTLSPPARPPLKLS